MSARLTHTPVDRARIAAGAIRAVGVPVTVARLMRCVRELRRSEAQHVVDELAGGRPVFVGPMRQVRTETTTWRCMTGARIWWEHYEDCRRSPDELAIGCIDAPDGYPCGSHKTIAAGEHTGDMIQCAATLRRDW